MDEFVKINTLFQRDMANKGRIIEDRWATPEFAFLSGNPWRFSEKLNGTNTRVAWDGDKIEYGGRTDNASIPTALLRHLDETFRAGDFERLRKGLPGGGYVLYGEGIGAGIQHGSGTYGKINFVLFDVLADAEDSAGRPVKIWLERHNVQDIGKKLGIPVAAELGTGTLHEAVDMAREGFPSTWGAFPAEGLVLRPMVELRTRRGDRVIGKIKTRDFR